MQASTSSTNEASSTSGRQNNVGHPSCCDAAASALPQQKKHSNRQPAWHAILSIVILLVCNLHGSLASGQDGNGNARVHRRPRKDQSMGRTLADHSMSPPPASFLKRSVDVRPSLHYPLHYH